MDPIHLGWPFVLAWLGFGVATNIVIAVVICLILSSCYNRIPAQFRQMEPTTVWLLVIPCFNVVWNFFVFPRVSASYKAYFDSVGRTDVGDCGRVIGLAYAICLPCWIIPFLNYLVGPAALVLLIVFLVKAVDLRNQIPPRSAA